MKRMWSISNLKIYYAFINQSQPDVSLAPSFISLSAAKPKSAMARDQDELRSLGFFGIFKESFILIFSRRKIFTKITLTLILPLSFIFLAHLLISHHLFSHIVQNHQTLEETQKGTKIYSELSDRISSEWIAFWIFKALYFTVALIFSLLSTSAVVYTIACVYTGKEITFRKVLKIVPKVWKRLIVTFLWSFLLVVVYNIVAVFLLVILILLFGTSIIGLVIILVASILYLVGFVYITIVWHIASVISVLEDVYGRLALMQSRCLIKGLIGVSVAIFVIFGACFVGIQVLFEVFVVFGSLGLGIRIVIGFLCFLLLMTVMLIWLVIQTVLYFVCKSYHRQHIDMSALADHLEDYLGEYVRLKPRDVQLEPVQV